MYSENLEAKQAAMRLKYGNTAVKFVPGRKYAPVQQGDDIVKFAAKHPELTWREIAAKFDCTMYAAYFAAKRRGFIKPRSAGLTGSSRPLNLKTPTPRTTSVKTLRQKQDAKILRYVQAHPEMTYEEISEAFGLAKHVVGQVVYRSGVRRTNVTEESKARNAKIADYVRAHPNLSYSDMGRELNLPTLYIARIARAHGLYRGKGGGPRHNQGRSFKGVLWSPEDRERVSRQMLAYWEKAPKSVRLNLSKALKGRWTPQARAAVGRALKSMWRHARA
jgi:hypothetical protein